MLNWLDNLPVTRAGLETKLRQAEQEMKDAGYSRKFSVAKQKDEELQKLQELTEYLVSEDPAENIVFLNKRIDRCVDAREWVQAESLHQVVIFIARQVDSFGTTREHSDSDERLFEDDSTNPKVLPTKRQLSSVSSSSSRMDREPVTRGRLTVLQARPLIWIDGSENNRIKNNRIKPFPPPPDFEHEKQTLEEALNHAKKSGGHIDVSFEAATTFRLAAFLATPDNRLLHYSGHGDKQFVTMENWGAAQVLRVEELKEFVSAGPGHLQFVFVSACYSRAAGEAFVESGVRHVVCCHQDEQLDDAAAIEFTRNFYLQLACGQTLRQAFKMAKAAVKIAPIDQDAKFILLPEKEEHDDYHDVLLFNAHPTEQVSTVYPDVNAPSSMLTTPIIGREIEMYSVMRNLVHSRFVHISGEPGVGKSTLGHAICDYVGERKDAFFFEDVFWCSRDFGGTTEMIADDEVDVKSKAFREKSKWIASQFHDRRVLIFIDGCRMSSTVAMAKLRFFLEVLFRGAPRVYVVLICPSGGGVVSKVIPIDAHVELGPLDMKSSVLLFGTRCPFVSAGLCPEVSTPKELVDLLVPDSQADAKRITPAMSKRCSDIFSRVGEGKPQWISAAAEDMTEHEYLDLIKLGMRQEFQRSNYDTRFSLDQEWSRLTDEFKMAKRMFDFGKAQQFKVDLEELEQLRESLPSLEELRLTEKELCARLDDAAALEEFEKAGDIQGRLKLCREKITMEEKAKVEPADGDDSTDFGPIYAHDSDLGSPGLRQAESTEQLPLVDTLSSNLSQSGLSPSVSNLGMYTVTPRKKRDSDDVGTFTLLISPMPLAEFKYSNRRSAIVCATNESCHLVHGVAGACLEAGGDILKKQVEKLDSDENNHLGPVRCPTGEARLVKSTSRFGGGLNVHNVVLAVGPTYTKHDGRDTLKKKDALLRLAYRSSLELARKEGLEAVAFSLISGGHRNGGDIRRPLRIAVEAIADFGYKELKKVQLCVFKKREEDILNSVVREMSLPQVTLAANA